MPMLNRTNSSPNLRDRNWRSNNGSRNLRNSPLDYNDDNDNNNNDEFYVIGDRVYIDGHRAGSVAYFGETEFGFGDWVGVVLDEPTGNHNGKLHGREYFQCAPYRGLFVRTHRVTRISDSALGSSATSSRCATPLLQQDHYKRRMDQTNSGNHFDNLRSTTPSRYELTSTQAGANTFKSGGGGGGGASVGGSEQQTRASSRMSTNSSLLDSYYYDEDYRQDQVPTVASLARKLKLMNDRQHQHSQQQQQRQQRPMSRATPTTTTTSSSSSSTSPIGILKYNLNNSNSNSNNLRSQFVGNYDDDEQVAASPPSNFGLRVDELNRRLRASSASPSASPRSVFNFRPKREQLSTTASRATSNIDSRHELPPASNSTYGKGAKRSVYLSAQEPLQKGDRVLIRTERGETELSGILRFMGETNFATGEWAGIELDDPVGKNDGSILGCRYFYCPKNYGLFVPATRVKKYDTNKHNYGSSPSIFGSMRSTIKSPPPPPTTTTTSLSRLSAVSRSTTPSYDDMEVTMSPASASTSSPSSQYSGGTAASRQRANYFTEYSKPSLTSLSQPSLANRSNSDYSNGRISPVAPIRDASLNRQNFFGDTTATSTTGDNNYKLSASSSSLFDGNNSYRRPKFDDRDIEIQLRKSLNATRPRATVTSSSIDLHSSPKPKAVKYTFISNKLDGNPIARRTLIYK